MPLQFLTLVSSTFHHVLGEVVSGHAGCPAIVGRADSAHPGRWMSKVRWEDGRCSWEWEFGLIVL